MKTQDDDEGLADFMVRRAPRGAIQVVQASALDGGHHWKQFFACGLATAIASDPDLQADFFDRVVGNAESSIPAEVVDAFLVGLADEERARLFDPEAVNDKRHPVNRVLVGAAHKTMGAHLLAVYAVLQARGMNTELSDIAARKSERALIQACAAFNEPFLRLVMSSLSTVPAGVIKAIVTQAQNAEQLIAFLIQECKVPVAVFSDPEAMSHASPSVAEFIVALNARAHRVPERRPAPKLE